MNMSEFMETLLMLMGNNANFRTNFPNICTCFRLIRTLPPPLSNLQNALAQ